MAVTPLVGTLAYLWDRHRDTVLMVIRTRDGDEHAGKYNGLGGKLERDESITGCIRRELFEEANVTDLALSLRGTVTWSNFGPSGADWLGFIFLCDQWRGAVPDHNDEGRLEWVDRSRLLKSCADNPAVRAEAQLPMWPGDRHFIPLVFDADPRPFHGTMPYDRLAPLSWDFERI